MAFGLAALNMLAQIPGGYQDAQQKALVAQLERMRLQQQQREYAIQAQQAQAQAAGMPQFVQGIDALAQLGGPPGGAPPMTPQQPGPPGGAAPPMGPAPGTPQGGTAAPFPSQRFGVSPGPSGGPPMMPGMQRQASLYQQGQAQPMGTPGPSRYPAAPPQPPQLRPMPQQQAQTQPQGSTWQKMWQAIDKLPISNEAKVGAMMQNIKTLAPLEQRQFMEQIQMMRLQNQMMLQQQAMPTGQNLDVEAEAYYQTGKFPPNMGRGQQTGAAGQAVIRRAGELHPDEPAETWPRRWQSFQAGATGMRDIEHRAAGLALASNEAARLLPRVDKLIDKVSPTDYPDINAIINAGETKTGNPDVVQMGIAIGSLIPVYARVLKPMGVIGQNDLENARGILQMKWSRGQMRAALQQMKVELQSAEDALDDTRKEYGLQPMKRGGAGQSSGGGTAAPSGGAAPEFSQDELAAEMKRRGLQ